MDQESGLTLSSVRKKLHSKEHVTRISDFLTEDEKKTLREVNSKGAPSKRLFDDVDAFCAEMVARFGYEVYEKWNSGLISDEKISRWLMAERARERGRLTNLEGIIIATVGSLPSSKKGGKLRRIAIKIFKKENELASGKK